MFASSNFIVILFTLLHYYTIILYKYSVFPEHIFFPLGLFRVFFRLHPVLLEYIP